MSMTIYVAGPISAPTLAQEHSNVMRAEDVFVELLAKGWSP